MKKKGMIATAVALMLLGGAVGAGVSAVYTVTGVNTQFHIYSENGKEQSLSLQEELNVFVGKNTTFLKLSEVEEVVAKYPCFRATRIEKKYPRNIQVEIYERKETFSVSTGNAFDIYDEEGVFLYQKENASNATGGMNVALERAIDIELAGFAESGKKDFLTQAVLAYRGFSAYLLEPRANIKKITLVKLGTEYDERNYSFEFTTTEGITLVLGNPSYQAEEKAVALVQSYLALSDEARLRGRMIVHDNKTTGEITGPFYYR